MYVMYIPYIPQWPIRWDIYSITKVLPSISSPISLKWFQATFCKPIYKYLGVILDEHSTFLGVSRKHTLAAAAGGQCWMPTVRRHQQQLILLWISFIRMDENRMCRRIYHSATNYAESNEIQNWISHEKRVFYTSSYDLIQWWENNNCGNLSKKECKEMIVRILFRLELRDEWLKEIQTKPKLRTYQLFKEEYGPEQYTNILTSRAHWSFLAKLRGWR